MDGRPEGGVMIASLLRPRPIRSLSELAELTAQRTECATLAAVNRAGFVTRAAQHADADVIEGVFVKQRAFVEGFVPEAMVPLVHAIHLPSRLTVIAHRTPRHVSPDPFGDAHAVTKEGGVTLRWAADFMAVPEIEEVYGPSCSRGVVAELCSMWQVAVIAKDWGDNDFIWPALAEFAESAARCSA